MTQSLDPKELRERPRAKICRKPLSDKHLGFSKDFCGLGR
jgi:hypothetical protein